MHPTSGRAYESLPPQTFEALSETLFEAAEHMSKEQVIDLADGLFDHLRARRNRSFAPRLKRA
jgi:hypothetical protein